VRAGRLLGFLAFDLEPAAKALGLRREAGYNREGPKFSFELLIGATDATLADSDPIKPP
jgi:hypothetical protein